MSTTNTPTTNPHYTPHLNPTPHPTHRTTHSLICTTNTNTLHKNIKQIHNKTIFPCRDIFAQDFVIAAMASILQTTINVYHQHAHNQPPLIHRDYTDTGILYKHLVQHYPHTTYTHVKAHQEDHTSAVLWQYASLLL